LNPENEEKSMLFREFNIIAAAAYAAAVRRRAIASYGEKAHSSALVGRAQRTTQNGFMQQVLAIARGDNPLTTTGDVFEATAKAILEYNGGQGGLALEEMANIGRIPLELELITARNG
jgi:hypothetical protein